MKRTLARPWLTTAALVTFAAGGWASQEVQQKPAATAASNDADEVAARRRAYEARHDAGRNQAARDVGHGPQGTERALYEQEQAHRLRLGRIARLRALLNERGDGEKLAKLDQIAAKESLRYARFTDIQKRKLAPDQSARAERALANGRQRGGDQIASRDELAQRERLERERAERQRQKRDNKPPKPIPPADAVKPAPQHPKTAGSPVGGR